MGSLENTGGLSRKIKGILQFHNIMNLEFSGVKIRKLNMFVNSLVVLLVRGGQERTMTSSV